MRCSSTTTVSSAASRSGNIQTDTASSDSERIPETDSGTVGSDTSETDTPVFQDTESATGEIRGDGTQLLYNGTNCWRLDDPETIEIRGTRCEDLLDGSVADITVTCPCDAVGD